MTTPPTAVALSSKVAPEPLQEADDDAAAQQQEQPRGFPWQRELWAFLDDPASSKPAKFFSLLMMSVIITSVINFCLASIPYNCWWENGGLINETAINETDGSTYVVEYLAYDPVRMCDKMQDNAPIPFETIEMVCIILFTIEFLLRVVTCVAGPGFVGFFTGICHGSKRTPGSSERAQGEGLGGQVGIWNAVHGSGPPQQAESVRAPAKAL